MANNTVETLGAPDDQHPDRDLMTRFCSLGSNCEFGQAQRAFKAEPIDLFRWSGISYQALTKQLRSQCSGLGDISNIEVHQKPGGKFMGWNPALHMEWHVDGGGDIPPEEMRKRESRRLKFLARKLMEEIAEASRIFVIKPYAWIPMSIDDAKYLAEIMTSYGGKPVLMVVHDGATSPCADRISDQIIHGHVVSFADGKDVPRTTRSADWLNLCRQAIGLLS